MRLMSSCRSMSSAASGEYREYFVYFMAPPSSSVELASRQSSGWLARIAGLRILARLGEVAAFLAAIDALLRPQALKDELGGAGLQGGIVLRAHVEGFKMLEEALD